jgi:hypothetical protein
MVHHSLHGQQLQQHPRPLLPIVKTWNESDRMISRFLQALHQYSLLSLGSHARFPLRDSSGRAEAEA